VKKVAAWLVMAAAAGVVAWLALKPAPPQEVEFVRVRREDLTSTLVTNGRVEPAQAVAIRASRAGKLTLHISRGERIRPGQLVAGFDPGGLQSELDAAQARLAQVETGTAQFDRGGPPAVIAEIEAGIREAKARRDTARREREALDRLLSKGAATAHEAAEARTRETQAEAQISALESKRGSLLPPEGRQAAEARIREARAAIAQVRTQIAQLAVTSPAGGVVFHLPVKSGAFVNAGDLIAEAGEIRTLRALVYVDEPELGRVAKGLPLKVTWDALPGAEWIGSIERTATQVAPLGSRQVGECEATIENADLRLPPGANVNVEIQTNRLTGVLTIPRSAVRREGAAVGVWILQGGAVAWRPVRVGISSVARAEVLEGLAENDAVALPTESGLKNQEKVQARFR